MGSEIVSTARSEELFARARALIPGGVSSPVRAFAAVGGTPRFIRRGEGAYLWDVDGRRYIDYMMSWGPLINGHAFPPVIDAIRQAAERGTSFGAPTEAEIQLAARVTAALPAMDMIRFVNSGTEAAMSAIRLARAYTGRDLVVKFAGHYHGHADMLLAQAGSGSLTLGIPTSPGVPAAVAATTIVAPFNDVGAIERIFAQRGSEIAAVIVEPIAANMGVVPPADGFLAELRSLTRAAGSLLLCDEVITGFRVSPGGAQGALALDPDLTILGKIIGGGLPVGAYGGRRSIMEQISPSGPVYQAGTLSGNPLAMAAGLANLEPLLDESFYQRLQGATDRLAAGLTRAADDAGVALTINRSTGMLTAFFTEGPVASLEAAQGTNRACYARFFHAMLDRGIYLPPSQFEAWMLSAAHTPDLIDRTVSLAAEALQEIARAERNQ